LGPNPRPSSPTASEYTKYTILAPVEVVVVVRVVVVVVGPVCKIKKNEEFCVTTHVLGACGGAVG